VSRRVAWSGNSLSPGVAGIGGARPGGRRGRHSSADEEDAEDSYKFNFFDLSRSYALDFASLLARQEKDEIRETRRKIPIGSLESRLSLLEFRANCVTPIFFICVHLLHLRMNVFLFYLRIDSPVVPAAA
jgi:hypothetical protein